MAAAPTDLLEILLRACAAAGPQPWYPSDYAKATGIPRHVLDDSLDQLRLGGLVRLTDWVQGKGQGYVVTPAGERVLERPRLLERLRAGDVPRDDGAAAAAPPSLGPRAWPGEKPSGWERAKAVRDVLLTPTRPMVTHGLLIANILVFLAGVPLAQKRDALGGYLGGGLFQQLPPAVGLTLREIRDDFGGLTRERLLEGQWWRLWATCFLHAGLLHLAMNMYFLYIVGPLLERMLGSGRYLLLYLIAGLTGSTAAVIFSPDPRTMTIGASGALCGLLGAMAAWVYLNRPYMPSELSGTWMRNILTNVILIVFISLMPGVSGWGHFGGGVGGLLAAVPLTYSRFGEGPRRWLGLLGALLVPAIAILWLMTSLAPAASAARGRAQVREARERGRQCYTLIEKLCQRVEQGRPLESKSVQAVRRAADQTRKRMQVLAGELPDPDKEPEPRVRSALKTAQEYLEAWEDLFNQFDKVFSAADEPTPEQARSVLERRGRIERLEDNLRDSVLSPDS
jgi:membrane associated rhomboid family serine protease